MKAELLKKLDKLINDVLPRVVELRHELHRRPEMALAEHATGAVIREWLGQLPLTIQAPLMGTDVIADLPGSPGRTVCLRADIDALPICEKNDLPYSSENPDIMHACGHDGHTAMLLGAATVLSALRHELPCNVRFVFQPGEEMICAGKELVARGACENADFVYALHGWPGLPADAVSSKAGVMFAAGAIFSITVKGKGCHGAMPENGKNPIPVMAKIIDKLHELHYLVRARDGSVVTVSSARAGSSSTVIPDIAVLEGTTRYLSREAGVKIINKFRTIINDISKEDDFDIELDYTEEYNTPVINSAAGYQHARSVTEKYMPSNQWIEAEKPTMGMEDFAFYLKDREGAMLWLGLGENSAPLHSAYFDFNDNVLATGIHLFCLLALTAK